MFAMYVMYGTRDPPDSSGNHDVSGHSLAVPGHLCGEVCVWVHGGKAVTGLFNHLPLVDRSHNAYPAHPQRL